MAVDAWNRLIQVNNIGFQGLFFERYDGDYTLPCIAPGVRGLYYARNRFYDPILGRFLQRDPNETALPIITALATNGVAVDILMGRFDVSSLYGDRMNLYLFATGNPINGLDPSGLMGLPVTVPLQGGPGAAVTAGVVVVGVLLLAMLAPHELAMQVFLEGVMLTQTGAYYMGEVMMADAEWIHDSLANAVAVGSATALLTKEELFKGKTIAEIIRLYIKGSIENTPWPPGGPDWKDKIKKTWEQIKNLAQKGEMWAKSLKKELMKNENWKVKPPK